MIDTSSASKKIHLHDWTLGRPFETACGIVDDDKLSQNKFEESDPAFRCETCEEELIAAKAYQLKCRICGELFDSQAKTAEHEQYWHVLTVVSGRKETPCFVLDLQRHYDKVHANARQMSRARQELKVNFPRYDFEFLPARMMLKSRGADNALLREAFVVEYAVVAR